MKTNSLRAQLLAGLMIPLGAFALVQFSVAYRGAEATSRVVTDQILVASARAIAEHVAVRETGVEAFAPPSALGMFDRGYSDSVYYRIARGDGRLLAGYGDLPTAEAPRRGAQPRFYDATYHGEAVRLVEVMQVVPAGGGAQDVAVVVAETLRGRNAMSRELWLVSAAQQFLLVALACLLAWFALRRVLAPLLQLGRAVRDRGSDDFRPFAVAALQVELDPLVRALNAYMLRLRGQLDAQRRFTANAAHQLRTPLALLRTQASYASRAAGAERADTMQAILATTEQLTRLTNQLLSLARAEPHGLPEKRDVLDMALVTREILEDHGRLAVDGGVDLAFEVLGPEAALVSADPAMLRDLIVNVVDNAVRYTPRGGQVIVTVERRRDASVLRVEDTGAGIPEAQRALVFERFFRLPGREPIGSGLGLAIVKEIAEAHGAQIEMSDRPGGVGLALEISFPAAPTFAVRGSLSGAQLPVGGPSFVQH